MGGAVGGLRGYTQSGVVGVALRKPSCQFSTGTGMHVSLMVSGQRRDRDGPLSSSSGAWLCTVSTGGQQRAGATGDTRGDGEERGSKDQRARKTQELMKKEQR